MSEQNNALKYIVYFIIVSIADLAILLGTGYAVFVLNESGWWFALAILICSAWTPAYKVFNETKNYRD